MKFLAALLMALAAALPAVAQEGPFPAVSAPLAAENREAQLDQLLAPVALYPDVLLAHILTASTYPLEVVALQRWLERNPNLPPGAIENAVESQPWDTSVKALAPFGSVVAMMNGELDWMQRLGNAFLESEPDVMDAVQRLRRRAREAGTLADSARERVIVEDDILRIEPAQPEVVYVPVYDPRVVYGSWGWPGYPPYVWSYGYFGAWDYVAGGLYFGSAIHVRTAWFDHRPEWRGRHVTVRRPGGRGEWRHDPIHRGGVPYADPRTRERFRGFDRDRARGREGFRGFDAPPRPAYRPQGQAQRPSQRLSPPSPRPSPPSAQRTLPNTRPQGASPAWPSPRAGGQQQSDRGRQSLGASRPSQPHAPPSRGNR